jgi:hypothetical protein
VYIQKLVRNSTIADAVARVLQDYPNANVLRVEAQCALLRPEDDVFVTLEVTRAKH